VDNNYINYKELQNLVYRSLFKLFIENEGNLHSFEVLITNNDYRYFNDNMELTLQNLNLFTISKIIPY
jgi:hypothetical protein